MNDSEFTALNRAFKTVATTSVAHLRKNISTLMNYAGAIVVKRHNRAKSVLVPFQFLLELINAPKKQNLQEPEVPGVDP